VVATPALGTSLDTEEAIVASLAQVVAHWHSDGAAVDTVWKVSGTAVLIAADVF
jgi:hypothetical protein